MMTVEATMTLTDFLSYLRERFVSAMGQRDYALLVELQKTLVVLQEAAWQVHDARRAALIEDMIAAGRDAIVGVEWKSDLPMVEVIRATASEG